MKNHIQDHFRRSVLVKLLLISLHPQGNATPIKMEKVTSHQQDRFKGIGMVLVVNAVANAEMLGAVIYDDRGWAIYGPAGRISKENRGIRSFNNTHVPLTVRAIWRKDPTPIWGKNGGIDYEGVIIRDYTIPVAERIPDEVLDNIRQHGGGLRLKFRLKPDGILFAWDIVRASPLGDVSIFELPGGDFLETRY